MSARQDCPADSSQEILCNWLEENLVKRNSLRFGYITGYRTSKCKRKGKNCFCTDSTSFSVVMQLMGEMNRLIAAICSINNFSVIFSPMHQSSCLTRELEQMIQRIQAFPNSLGRFKVDYHLSFSKIFIARLYLKKIINQLITVCLILVFKNHINLQTSSKWQFQVSFLAFGHPCSSLNSHYDNYFLFSFPLEINFCLESCSNVYVPQESLKITILLAFTYLFTLNIFRIFICPPSQVPFVDGQPNKYIKRKENNLVFFKKNKTYTDIAQD